LLDREKDFHSLFGRHGLPVTEVSLVGLVEALEDANDLVHTRLSYADTGESAFIPFISGQQTLLFGTHLSAISLSNGNLAAWELLTRGYSFL
jgi:hypothetical protein